MYKSYQEIFNRRGHAYHAAMLRNPKARAAEFCNIIDLADIRAGHTVFDMPSGGGYLGAFITAPVDIVSVETSSQFIRDTEPSAHQMILLCHSLAAVRLPDACADRILSLAGLHHLEDKTGFYREAWRLLKPGGLFCVADALDGSRPARFLNEFVHESNSMGHCGVFLTQETSAELRTAGFTVLHEQPHRYTWDFADRDDMAAYCQSLFGMDRADLPAIADGIGEYLGYEHRNGQCRMNWELHFLKGQKGMLPRQL